LSPGGSTHLHTNNKQNNTNNNRITQITTNVEECGPCPVFASFTLAFALQMRKNHGKTSVRVRKTCQVKKNLSQYTVYILQKHPHITKPKQTHTLQPPHTHTHTLQNPHTHTHTHSHTHTHITKQYKTTTVKIKTNTVQDIPK
jgi:hypothetical protein